MSIARRLRLGASAAGLLSLGLIAASPAAPLPLPSAATVGESAGPVAAARSQWHLAPSLVQLRAEIDARWPDRSRASDGTRGDKRHQRTVNGHNPVGGVGGPEHGTTGAVHALDITASGIDTDVLLRAVIGDPRVWYVIHDGRIWSRTHGWAARRQSGDPHTSHVHISLRESTQKVAVAAESDTSRWLPRTGSSARGAKLSEKQTRALQRALIKAGYAIPSGPTGWYGPETTKAVARFQRAQGWTGSGADGIAGSTTLRRLGVSTGQSGDSAAERKAAGKKAAAKKAAKKKAAKKKAEAKKAQEKAKEKAKENKDAASAKARAAVYRPGVSDPRIYYLQQALIKRGYAIPAGPTGYFGTRTLAAVKAFQIDQGWSDADGLPGRATLRALGLL